MKRYIILSVLCSTSLFAMEKSELRQRKNSKVITSNPKVSKTDQAEEIYNLGHTYLQKKNYKKAFESFLEAAQQNHLKSMYNVALLYKLGQGIIASEEEAIKWFVKAAAAGDRDARGQLEFLGKCRYICWG